MDFDAYRVLTFDCYGTLVDWESGIGRALAPLISRAGREVGPDEVLEAHGFHESAQQALTPTKPYRLLLATVYRRLAEDWGVPVGWDECLRYGNSVGDWPAFADSREALRKLKSRYRLVILSNVDNASFALSSERLGIEFDAVFTAEDIGSYKPDPANFSYMLDQLARRGFARSEILHVAESLFHDHVPANRFGLDNCRIHRRRGKQGLGATRSPGEMPRFKATFGSLGEFADACS